MKKQTINGVLFTAAIGILALRLFLGITRYFDVDEFAHLHWSYLISVGKLPYRDFFFYIAPLFQWFLQPLFWLPASPGILIIARVIEWIVYVLLVLILYKLSWTLTKNMATCLLAVIIFITFPMTFDKTIEIRPDLLMTLLFVLGVWLLTIKRSVFWASVSLATGLLLLPKIVFAIPSVLFLITSKQANAITVKRIGLFFLGGLLPLLLFALYLSFHGLWAEAVHAILKDSVAVNAGKVHFSPLVLLSPFPIVYTGDAGISFPWLVNMAVWVSAPAGLIILFFKNRMWSIFFFLFFAGAIISLFLFPAPYVQYFLPISVFASLLSAVFFETFISFAAGRMANFGDLRRRGSAAGGDRRTRQNLPPTSVALLYVFFCAPLLISFFIQFRERAAANNDEQLQVIRDVLRISKPSDTFYDMVGSYVFRPDGYYICCHPYAEFIDRLTPKPQTLRESLIKNNTKFLVLDRTGQSLWLPYPDDLTFLKANYIPSAYPKIYIRK